MRIAAALVLSVVASLAAAKQPLTESQAKAATVLTPMLADQIPEQHLGNLVDCMVVSARARELREIGAMDPATPDAKTVATINKLIARPAVRTCLTERLKQ